MDENITLERIIAEYELHEEAYQAVSEWNYEATDFEGIKDLLEGWFIED